MTATNSISLEPIENAKCTEFAFSTDCAIIWTFSDMSFDVLNIELGQAKIILTLKINHKYKEFELLHYQTVWQKMHL